MTACHEGFDCDRLSQSARKFQGGAQKVLCFLGGIYRLTN